MAEIETSAKGNAPGSARDELVFMALGGLGEIGMNVYLYGFGPPQDRKWLMVDLGITFPGEAEPGADVVLPDLRFITAERHALTGLVLTHAHEDHIGAVLELWPHLGCPIYATPFTAGMVRSKLAEYGKNTKLPINVVPLGARVQIAPFDVEFVTLAHSIPEPSGLAIRTPAGVVFHTGDWKFDATPLVGAPPDEAKLKALGDAGGDAQLTVPEQRPAPRRSAPSRPAHRHGADLTPDGQFNTLWARTHDPRRLFIPRDGGTDIGARMSPTVGACQGGAPNKPA